MLNNIKASMRITHNKLDADIQRNINACLLDLQRVGVEPYKKENGEYVLDDEGKKVIKDDELIKKACEIYCKREYDYGGKGERFEKNYELLRDSLSLSEDYRGH